MAVTTVSNASGPTALGAGPDIFADRLLSAPLPHLLAEHGAVVKNVVTDDPTFFGSARRGEDGRIELAVPARRSRQNRDNLTRYLLDQILDSTQAKLPAPLVTFTPGRS